MQTKKHSRIESLTNAIVGIIMSVLIQMIIYPLMDIPVTINQNLTITIIFFLASYLRSYVIRRVFNNETEIMIYAIERRESSSPYSEITKTFLYESKELRDKVFNKIIKEAKNDQYIKGLEYNEEEISFSQGGKLIVNMSKIELKLSTEENAEEAMFSL